MRCRSNPKLNRDERARLVALVDAPGPCSLGPAPRDRDRWPWNPRSRISEPDRLVDRGLARCLGERLVEWPGDATGDGRAFLSFPCVVEWQEP